MLLSFTAQRVTSDLCSFLFIINQTMFGLSSKWLCSCGSSASLWKEQMCHQFKKGTSTVSLVQRQFKNTYHSVMLSVCNQPRCNLTMISTPKYSGNVWAFCSLCCTRFLCPTGGRTSKHQTIPSCLASKNECVHYIKPMHCHLRLPQQTSS